MTSKISKTVSIVLIRLLDQYLIHPEICWHFKIFICGLKISKIEMGRLRLDFRFLTLVLACLMLKYYDISKWAGPAKIFTRQIILWVHQMLATILSLLMFRIAWYWSKPFYIPNINWLILAKSFHFSNVNLLILIETLRLFICKSTGFR